MISPMLITGERPGMRSWQKLPEATTSFKLLYPSTFTQTLLYMPEGINSVYCGVVKNC